jgi:hypothetical protein
VNGSPPTLSTRLLLVIRLPASATAQFDPPTTIIIIIIDLLRRCGAHGAIDGLLRHRRESMATMRTTMLSEARSNLLVVPPFECAWLADENLMFPEGGRGCIAFEACTDNDITVVLKEKAGSKHYRTDPDPYYAIVLGSHRNRRIKIEMDGIPVFDAPGVVISPSPSRFERFWISIFDGHICVGKGDPGKGILFEWEHPDNSSRCVRYVGLSSWDKHVGYRNIRVLHCKEMHHLLHRRRLQKQQQQWQQPQQEQQHQYPWEKSSPHSASVSTGLGQFLESYDFADLHFCVGSEERLVPTHRLVLACCCPKFRLSPSFGDDIVRLPHIEYQVLHAFLQYIYTGKTQVLHALQHVLLFYTLTCIHSFFSVYLSKIPFLQSSYRCHPCAGNHILKQLRNGCL